MKRTSEKHPLSYQVQKLLPCIARSLFGHKFKTRACWIAAKVILQYSQFGLFRASEEQKQHVLFASELAGFGSGIKMGPKESEAILNAVSNLDLDFLGELKIAAELFQRDSGWLEIDKRLMRVWGAYVVCANSSDTAPTLRRLSGALASMKPALVIEDRTLLDICKRYKVELSPDRKGRPKSQK